MGERDKEWANSIYSLSDLNSLILVLWNSEDWNWTKLGSEYCTCCLCLGTSVCTPLWTSWQKAWRRSLAAYSWWVWHSPLQLCWHSGFWLASDEECGTGWDCGNLQVLNTQCFNELPVFVCAFFHAVTLSDTVDLRGSTLRGVSVWRNSSPARLGGPPLSGHIAQHVNGRGVQRSEIIAEEDTCEKIGVSQTHTHSVLFCCFQLRTPTYCTLTYTAVLFYLLNVLKTSELSACLASLCPGGRHNTPISIS